MDQVDQVDQVDQMDQVDDESNGSILGICKWGYGGIRSVWLFQTCGRDLWGS